MPRKKTARIPKDHQPFYNIPTHIIKLVTQVPPDNINVPIAVTYINFIAVKYDSRNRKHTIPVSDSDFADFAGIARKYASVIRQTLTRHGYIVSKSVGRGAWKIAWCSKDFALNQLYPCVENDEKDDMTSQTDGISSISETADGRDSPVSTESDNVGTETAKGELHQDLKTLTRHEKHGLKVKTKNMTRTELVELWNDWRCENSKRSMNRKETNHFQKRLNTLIDSLVNDHQATKQEALNVIGDLLRNRMFRVQSELGLQRPPYSIGIFAKSEDGRRLLVECLHTNRRRQKQTETFPSAYTPTECLNTHQRKQEQLQANSGTYTVAEILDCFKATVALKHQRTEGTDHQHLSDAELRDTYEQTVASMTNPDAFSLEQ